MFLSVGKGKEFDRDLQAAGLPKRDPATGASFSPHSLRHFACMYLASGNALSDAERQAAMTHEARRMTTETYNHPEHEVIAEKIFRLQPLLPPVFTPNPGRDPREKPRKLLDRRGENADTSPAKSVITNEPPLTPTQSHRPGAPTSHSEPLRSFAAGAIHAAAGPPTSAQLNGVEGSNPFTPIGCKSDPVSSGFDRASIAAALARAVLAQAAAIETLAALLHEEQAHVRSDQQRTTESA